jgi:anti-anti-sigma regulatory factor
MVMTVGRVPAKSHSGPVHLATRFSALLSAHAFGTVYAHLLAIGGAGQAVLSVTLKERNGVLMLHIKKIHVSRAVVIWKLEGRLAGETCQMIRRELEQLLSSPQPTGPATPLALYLDLGGVSFMDESGTELLRESAATLAGIVDCQEYVRALLYENGLQGLLTARQHEPEPRSSS